ncbi:hypothetical protein KEM56_004009 [Ascosphaera pollenicola]|nr:hypothetical protein KEM56_004009 [Ascosphaera pollenicola]
MSPSSSSSSPSPTATSTETSSLVKVKTDTPDGTRKSRARKRHRHRKTRSRSENDLDSPSAVNSGRHEGDVMTGDADKGHRARTTGNVQNAEPRGEQYQGVLPGREESKPTESSAPSRSRDDAGDADTAGGASRPRASTNSTGPMIVDSNVSRRSTVSSQQDAAQQPYHPPQPQPQANAPAPFASVAPSALHPPRANSHHPFNRRGRDSFGGTSAAAAASASTTAAGRNTVAVRLGPARRAIPTAPTSTTPPCRQLSTTTTVGSITITVFLPGMEQPITFHDVPQKRYTNLPDHRPPLRRDKPVRIMLPGSGRTQGLRGSYSGDRLIYPAADRSFIFIPRELRPNHRTMSTYFGRDSGRRRGRGGGHDSGGSLDCSAYNAEMLRQGYHGRRVQQQQQQQQQQPRIAIAIA